MPVRQIQVFANRKLQDLCGVLRLLGSCLDSASRAHFTLRHIKRTRPIAKLLQLQHRPPDRQLKVIGMRKNSEYVHPAHSLNLTQHAS